MRQRPLSILLLAACLVAAAAADSRVRVPIAPAKDDHADDSHDATDLPLGPPLAGRLELSSDADCFRVVVTETHRPIQFELTVTTPSTRGLRFELLDATGERELESCRVPGPGARRLFLFPRRKRTYLLRVSDEHGSPGARYTVAWGPVRDDHGDDRGHATTIELGRPVRGALETSADADWFAVRLERGRAYRIAWHGVFEVRLHAPSGQFLRRGELGVMNGVYAQTDGVYTIEVGPSQATGNYELRVEQVELRGRR